MGYVEKDVLNNKGLPGGHLAEDTKATCEARQKSLTRSVYRRNRDSGAVGFAYSTPEGGEPSEAYLAKGQNVAARRATLAGYRSRTCSTDYWARVQNRTSDRLR